jgi:hypothetical protein
MICTVDGMTATCGTEVQLNSNEKTAYYISTLLLKSGKVFVAHTYGVYQLYAQIFGIDEANNVPTNNVTIAEYETQVRKATTSDIYGVAKTGGMGAYKAVEYVIPEGESVSKGENREYSIENLVQGDIIPKTWTVVTETKTNIEWVAGDGTKLTASDLSTTANASISTKYACDGEFANKMWVSNKDTSIHWLKLEFPTEQRISKMKLSICESVSNPHSTFVIQGSNNNSTWVNLSEEISTSAFDSAKPSDPIDIELSNAEPYKYYRIYTENAIYNIYVYEWQVSECVELISQKGTALQSGTAGDTIQIAVPLSNEESTGHKDIVSIYTI